MTNNTIALVTGAAKGIGKAIVDTFVSEGYYTLAVDIDKENGQKLLDEYGSDKVAYLHADVSNEEEVRRLFDSVQEQYGRLNILVNNAGIIRDNLIWNMELDDFDKVLSVNLRGVWLMCREAAKCMKDQNGGRIVNIVSRAWLGNRGQSNYSASKAGVVGLTRVLALELGKYNVLVNAVAPGLIDTPLTQKLESHVLDKLIAAQPTRSMGRPQDVANAVRFLASPATQFITGQTIYVDGGKSIGAGV